MEFIEKYARVEGSDDEMEEDAGGDEVNEFDSYFVDDETSFQDLEPSFDECHQRFERSHY